MDATARAQAFLPLIEAHREALADLVVPGFLIQDEHADVPVAEHPLPEFPLPAQNCPLCSYEMHPHAQFWAHGRLWRFQFCSECIQGAMDSAGVEHGLTDGQRVAGNSLWCLTPARFLVPVDGARWTAHPALRDLKGMLREGEDVDDFHRALALVFGTVRPNFASLNRLGGVEDPIQFPNEPDCPVCARPMTFLAQVSEESGFAWGDAGAASLFACKEHPAHTHVAIDTH